MLVMMLSVESLLNEINVLKTRVAELEQANQAQQQELQAQLEELNLYRRKRFGRSAEPHPPQGAVFNEAEAEADTGGMPIPLATMTPAVRVKVVVASVDSCSLCFTLRI
ncbi:MAG: hypothetical protein VB135_03040 [Burkholderia sp.]